MAQLYDVTRDREITHLVNALPDQSVKQIVNTALDGTTYIQITGRPSRIYELDIYVNEQGKARLEEAEAGCNLLRVSVATGTYYGRITKKSIKKMSVKQRYQASVTLAAEETS